MSHSGMFLINRVKKKIWINKVFFITENGYMYFIWSALVTLGNLP